MQLFGSSGIRDTVNKEFLQQIFEVGLSVGSFRDRVVVGCDTRTSSDAMKYSFLSGLLSAGAKAYDAGLVSTPTLAYSARHFAAGAMLTASHNPPQYNGVKLFNPDGSGFNESQRTRIEAALEAKSAVTASWEKMQKCAPYPDAVELHLKRVLADFPSRLKLRVAVDCGGGAASLTTPPLLSGLGCVVMSMYCEPSGLFKRPSEPTPENLKELAKRVVDSRADLGIAHDGDADRLAVIDEQGRFVPQDKLLALFASDMKAKTVVATTDTSMLLDDMGFQVTRTRVGDAFVSEEMVNGGDFGGEPSGCFIFPSVSLCPDAIYAAARILQIASGHRLSALVDEIPSYPVLRGSVPADRSIMAGLEKKLKGKGKSMDTRDGIKVTYSDGWLLLRPSGTEPRIRITAEAKKETKARELYDLGLEMIKQCQKAAEKAAA